MPAMRRARAERVADYLKMVPEDARIALEKLRRIIRAAAPDTTEVISYRIPIFKYQGHPLVGLGATENHCSFYVMSSSMIPKLARARAGELKECDVKGATNHFTPDKPLPAALVTKLVKERIAEKREAREKVKWSLEGRSSRLATLGQVLFQDASFQSVSVGSEPQLDDFDALLTAYSLGLDKLPLPYFPCGVPTLLAGLLQLLTPMIVVCPIINPPLGRSRCRFSMPHGMVARHSSSLVDAAQTPV